MNISFYNGAGSAWAQQQKIDVIANNMANLETNGYKAKNLTFADLLHSNMRAGAAEDTTMKNSAGAGVRDIRTMYSEGTLRFTEQPLDYYIEGNGFFAVENQETDEIFYTRDGNFHMAEDGNRFYLATANGEYVLDSNERPIEVKSPMDNLDVGVFRFEHNDVLVSEGANKFSIPEDADEPEAVGKEDGVTVHKGLLEASNVELSMEMTRLIEAQRAFQMNLRMVQTSDEITQTIQNLR